MEKENYLYFGEATLGGSTTAVCYPASSFIGARPSATTKIRVMFKSQVGTLADDYVDLTFTTAGAHQNAMRAIARALNNPQGVRSNFITIFDGGSSVSAPIDNFNGVAQAFTACNPWIAALP